MAHYLSSGSTSDNLAAAVPTLGLGESSTHATGFSDIEPAFADIWDARSDAEGGSKEELGPLDRTVEAAAVGRSQDWGIGCQ